MKDVAHVTIRRCPTCNNIREHTARVREMLRGDPTVPVEIEDGAKGEFTVLVNGRVVAKTQPDGTLPTEALILDAVRQAEPAESSKMGNDRCSNTLTPNRT